MFECMPQISCGVRVLEGEIRGHVTYRIGSAVPTTKIPWLCELAIETAVSLSIPQDRGNSNCQIIWAWRTLCFPSELCALYYRPCNVGDGFA
jgi:hypothetical protein